MNTTVYDCDMSAGFGFAAGLPPPPPFFDDGRSVHFAVYVSFRRIFRPSHRADLPPFPPILGSLVVPRRAFFAAPMAVTLSILSAVGVAAPPGVLDHFAPRMSSFAWLAASAAAHRILPLCVHILAVTYPLTYSYAYDFGPSFPLTYHRNHRGGPGIRSVMARSPMDMTTRGYGYDYDYDYDRTEEVFDDAADLVPLTESTADHAPENEAAFEEYFSSPESDEDGDETEDEDEDEDRDENEDEDREAESTEPDSLRFEYFFSSSEDEDEDEDEIEGFDDQEHSISTEARSGPSSATRRATAHAHGAVLDDDGGVLRNLFRSDDWEDDDDVSGFDGIGLRGLFRLDSDGESSDEASVQTDQTTRFSRSVEGGEYSSSLSLLLDALSSLARRRARDRTDRDQYFRNNSDGDRDDHAADRNNDDDDDDDDDGIDGDYFDYDDDDDINVEEFMLGVVPATKSSIEALEEVTTTTTTSAKDQCAICLEDFSSPIESNGHDYLESENGDDHDHDHNHNHDDQNKVVVVVVLRMPCSHLYHKECIVQWLEKSHLCPLCRYSMPTFDDTTSDLSLEETSNAIGMTLNSRLRLVDVVRYAAFGERYRP